MFRSLYDATLIAAAWPPDLERPSFALLWRRNATYTVIAIVVMSPWATLSFISGAISFGPFLIASIAASLLTALAMPPALITGQWWRPLMPWRALLQLALAWLAMMLASLSMMFCPRWLTVFVAAVAGLVNALLWRQIVAAVARAPRPHGNIPVSPIALVVIVVGFIGGGTYWNGDSRNPQRSQPWQTAAQVIPPGQGAGGAALSEAVIFVAGFNTAFDGKPRQLLGANVSTWFFSYNGLGPGGTPQRYQPIDTHRSLSRSAELLAAQVMRLHELSGGPVAIVADSEGVLVARTYLAQATQPPVDHYIESSPLPRPSWVYYPPAGRAGFGLLGGWETREIFRLSQLEHGQFEAGADIPFLRSIVDDAPLLRSQVLCPVRGVPTFLFMPLQSAMMIPRGPVTPLQWVTIAGWHGTLLARADVQREIVRLLSTGALPHRSGWMFSFQVLRGLAAAWHAPALPLSFPPWHASLAADPAFDGFNCPAVGAMR